MEVKQMKKDKTIAFRTTDELKNDIELKAKDRNMSTGAYISELVRRDLYVNDLYIINGGELLNILTKRTAIVNKPEVYNREVGIDIVKYLEEIYDAVVKSTWRQNMRELKKQNNIF